MKHGSTNHFPGRTADSTSALGDSLYERIGLLPPAERVSGRRRHDPTVLYRLAIIQRARLRGCTLSEIRHLFFGFRDITHAPGALALSQRNPAELDHLMDGIKAVRGVLKKLMTKCRCDTLDQCGKGIFQSMNRDVASRSTLRVIDIGKNMRRVWQRDAVGALRIAFGISALWPMQEEREKGGA